MQSTDKHQARGARAEVRVDDSGLGTRPSALREVYMDNAATSFPKPPSVERALLAYHRDIGASAGRGAYPRAVAAGRLLDETRRLLARLFNVRKPEQIIYTFNASDALNLAIKGIRWQRGDCAVVSV